MCVGAAEPLPAEGWPMTDLFTQVVNLALGVLSVVALLAVVVLLVYLTRR
jgi:hypothetical protein